MKDDEEERKLIMKANYEKLKRAAQIEDRAKSNVVVLILVL